MQGQSLAEVWAWLSASPLLGLTATLLAYQGGLWIYRRSRMNPLCNPVLLAISAMVAFILLTGIPYETYFKGAQIIHFLLGPATVALAIPLYRQWDSLRRSWLSILAALLAGSATAMATGTAIGWALGASESTLLALAPKSVTAPIAMGIAEKIGGLPSLTAVLVILTGITGAVFGGWALDLVRVRNQRARGLAIGTASHGIGTARALQLNETAGAYAGLAMGLNGLATAILLPLLIGLFK